MCPFGHTHQTSLPDPDEISSGIKSPFFVGCHSFTKSGYSVGKSFSPLTNLTMAPSRQNNHYFISEYHNSEFFESVRSNSQKRNGLPPKKQQAILCYMVRPVIFTHLLLTLLAGRYIDLCGIMWSRKFSVRQNIEIYRHLWRYFIVRIPLDT